jgi:hypothetical protein
MIDFRKALLREYTEKLFSCLLEVDLTDKQGNVLISKDLKVRHKSSGLEYTVDDVISNQGKLQVVLREPEEPRVEPQEKEQLISDSDKISTEYQDFSDLMLKDQEDQKEQEDTLYVIDKSEFEKDYEIE